MSLSEITRASVLFSLKFRRNLAHQDKDIFFIPLAITFLHLKILGFLFPTKSSLTWGEMSKTKLQKIAGNLLDKLRKLHINGRIISKSLAFLK